MGQRLELRIDYQKDLEKYIKANYPQIVDYKIISQSLDARKSNRGVRPSYHYVLEIIKKGEYF